jgi:hypothetical protein
MESTDFTRQTGHHGSKRPAGHGLARHCGLAAAAMSLAFACSARTPPDDLANPAELTALTAASWQRLAFNALLVPLFEPEGDLVWAQPNEMLPCRDSAEVSVDGRPIPYGQRLPVGKPIAVRFRLNDCWPLGSAWIGLSGTLDMTLVHEGSRVAATARPRGLSAAANGARVALPADFVGVVSLAPAAARP